MKPLFSQWATLSVETALTPDLLDRLTQKLHRESEIKYRYTVTEYGYFLEPVFGGTWRRNSFTPEIKIALSQEQGYTTLQMTGQPIRGVRVFVVIYMAFALLMEAMMLLLAAFSAVDHIVPLLLPIGLCVFGYCLSEQSTKMDFQIVVKAMEKILL